jgi:hypothetical protein
VRTRYEDVEFRHLSIFQRLLDEAGGDEDKPETKSEAVGGRTRVLQDGTYATETVYSSSAAARLEAVKAAAKPPLRCKFWSILETSLPN